MQKLPVEIQEMILDFVIEPHKYKGALINNFHVLLRETWRHSYDTKTAKQFIEFRLACRQWNQLSIQVLESNKLLKLVEYWKKNWADGINYVSMDMCYYALLDVSVDISLCYLAEQSQPILFASLLTMAHEFEIFEMKIRPNQCFTVKDDWVPPLIRELESHYRQGEKITVKKLHIWRDFGDKKVFEQLEGLVQFMSDGKCILY